MSVDKALQEPQQVQPWCLANTMVIAGAGLSMSWPGKAQAKRTRFSGKTLAAKKPVLPTSREEDCCAFCPLGCAMLQHVSRALATQTCADAGLASQRVPRLSSRLQTTDVVSLQKDGQEASRLQMNT